MDAVGTVGGVLLSKAASLVGARWGERRKAREAARGRLRSVVAHVQAQLDTADAFHVMAQRRLDVTRRSGSCGQCSGTARGPGSTSPSRITV